MAKQFGDFLGQFLECDAKSISKGYQSSMRIQVRIDVKNTMKRRKKIVLGNKGCIYVRFQYERLLMFCFLCGRLGHSERFFLERIVHGKKYLVFEWDLSIKMIPKRAMMASSCCLREEREGL
ncbi:hypothetical protein ES319_D04G125000v1 [Gossypium barbadense]|uniref:Zinc knuckle CX2CX4HX4C domain-containing protein n=1 Tax=Gossypium barbadense TaxID=3634 RepID=A0A5J5RV89_GOSBA|nr:hypothetical protein ES319_D04G125000v1 [Gossypium barbadense]